MRAADQSSAQFFEAKYKATPDPWKFRSSLYERQRYDAILAALSHKRYQRAFEPGCSVGVLTEGLSAICDEVEAIDFSATAVDEARRHCAHLANVQVSRASLQASLPLLGFDVVVLSEIGYYFQESQWSAVADNIVSGLQAGATLLAAHWLGYSEDHRISGDAVHEILRAKPGLHLDYEERHEGFRLDRWSRL